MLRFECDYGEGAAPAVLELLQKTNFDQTPGYGEDEYCAKAARSNACATLPTPTYTFLSVRPRRI